MRSVRGKKGRGASVAGGRGRGRSRGGSMAGENRTQPSTSTPSRPSELPQQYNFTPAPDLSPPRCVPLTQTQLHVHHFPPPTQLFDNSSTRPTAPPPLPSNPQPQMRSSSNPQGPMSPPPSYSNLPLQNSEAQSNQASEAQHSNELEEDGIDGIDDSAEIQPNLQEDQLRYLETLLRMPDRHQWTTVLSPLRPQPLKTTWFGRDKSVLVRKITKIFTNKFDGAYYSWSCVPRPRAERYFIEFSKEHTWDPLITGTVQAHFEAICQRRMKDMVSKAHTSRVRPTWISETIWTEMCTYWDTDEGIQRSQTTSAARNSDRGGLGPYKNFTWQKSFQQIHQEMEEELGRPVSIGEVFLKTHTKSDGTYVDMKAQKIAETYEKSLQAKLSEFDAETSDGTSRPRELTTDEYNDLFIQSTIVDGRGHAYGIGSLGESHVTGKRKYPGSSSSSYHSLQQQLEEAKRQIEAQSARNEKLEAELARQAAEHHNLSIMEKYLRKTDPGYLDFRASQSDPTHSSP